MKNLMLFSCMTLLVINSYGQVPQDYDSLKQKILKMDQAINSIHMNMRDHQKQFRMGTGLQIAGVAVTLAYLIPRAADDIGEPNKKRRDNLDTVLLIAGPFLTTVGTVIQIDSHKYLGRGGRKKKNPFN